MCLHEMDKKEIRRQVAVAEADFKKYLEEKRRISLVKLIQALTLGMEAHCEEQTNLMKRDYELNFLPSLVRYIVQTICFQGNEIFEQNDFEIEPSDIIVSEEVTREIRDQVSGLLCSYKKAILEYIEEKGKLTIMSSLDILAQHVLDIEAFWVEKTRVDVENLHKLKLQQTLGGIGNEVSAREKGRRIGFGNGDYAYDSSRDDIFGLSQEDNCTPPPITLGPRKMRIRDLNSDNILSNCGPDYPNNPISLSLGPEHQSLHDSHQRHTVELEQGMGGGVDSFFHQADRIKEKMLHKALILHGEVERTSFIPPVSLSHAAARVNPSYIQSPTSPIDKQAERMIRTVQGEYLESGTVRGRGRGRGGGGGGRYSPQRIDRDHPLSSSGSRRVTSEKDLPLSDVAEAYRLIGGLRAMNLQADLFLERQKALNMSLRIELQALEITSRTNNSVFSRNPSTIE